MSGFKVGDRVGVTAAWLARNYQWLHPESPKFGHIVSIGGQSLIWVRDKSGGEWGLRIANSGAVSRCRFPRITARVVASEAQLSATLSSVSLVFYTAAIP